MSQPPRSARQPDWRRPRGVATGTWKYVNERSIADHYDAFVADTPLCSLDEQIIDDWLPETNSEFQTVLDLGCGTGRLAFPLLSYGYRVVGIDLSHHMLRRMLAKARQTFPGGETGSKGPSKLSAVHANLVDLDCLVTDSADHAICMFSTLGMIQGRSNRIRLLRHVRRIIRPGGTLILHVHRRWAAIRERGGIARLLRGYLDSVRSKQYEFGDATYSYRGLDDMFMHRFGARELRGELSQAGWTIQRFERVDLTGEGLTKSVWGSSGFIVQCD